MEHKIWAHRGASGTMPENTLEAFWKAVEFQADGVELDIQYTKDKQIVVCHDETLERTSNGTGFVKDHTLEELKQLDFSKTHPEAGVVRIPTMKEVFELLKPTNLTINIELKTGIFDYTGIEEDILKLTKEMGFEDRVIYSSFNHYSVMRVKEIAPEIKCGLLEESWLFNAGEYVAKSGVECFHPFYKNMTKELAAEVKSHGLEINTWTANEEDEILELIRNGVDGIISNEPELVKKVIAFCDNF